MAKVLVTCDGIGNLCTFTVIQCVAFMGKLANTLVAASIDCITDPFLCTYDVVTALDVANTFVITVFATSVCPAIPPPLESPRRSAVMTPAQMMESEGVSSNDMNKFYERRLLSGGEKKLDNVTESLMERFSYNATVQDSAMTLYNKFFANVAHAKTVEEQHAEMQRNRMQLHRDLTKFGELTKAMLAKAKAKHGDEAEEIDPKGAAPALARAMDLLRERLAKFSQPQAALGAVDHDGTRKIANDAEIVVV